MEVCGGGYNTNKLFAGPNRSCSTCNEFISITKWKTAPRPLIIPYSNATQPIIMVWLENLWLSGDGGQNGHILILIEMNIPEDNLKYRKI